MTKEQQIESVKKELSKVEAQLEKNRTTVMADGWQTMRHAKKSRNWDFYAQRKRDLQNQLDELTA
jgi:allantoicase